MSRKYERSSAEYYKGIIKRQQSEIRALKRALGRATKNVRNLSSLEPDLSADENVIQHTETFSGPSCPKCSKTYETTEIGNRVLHVCECGWRKCELQGIRSK